MMRLAALDLGDVWIGIAISDVLGIVARPHDTIRAENLDSYISSFIGEHTIGIMVVGHPQTLRGTVSQQTEKVEEQFKQLEQQFPEIGWVLWDERLTSKQASSIKKAKTKQQKNEQHAIAAALILQSYLERLHFIKNQSASAK